MFVSLLCALLGAELDTYFISAAKLLSPSRGAMGRVMGCTPNPRPTDPKGLLTCTGQRSPPSWQEQEQEQAGEWGWLVTREPAGVPAGGAFIKGWQVLEAAQEHKSMRQQVLGVPSSSRLHP